MKNTKPIRYFRVVGSDNRVLSDLLPEDRANKYVERWNSRPVARIITASLIPLEVRPCAPSHTTG